MIVAAILVSFWLPNSWGISLAGRYFGGTLLGAVLLLFSLMGCGFGVMTASRHYGDLRTTALASLLVLLSIALLSKTFVGYGRY